MFKKGFTIILAVVAGASAFAGGSLNFDGRFDHDNASFNKESAKSGYSKNTMHTGRLDYKGNVSEDLSYRIRIRFNKEQGAVNTRDSLNKTVDYAAVTHKMGNFALTAGKFDMGFSGFEGRAPSADQYYSSQAFQAILDRYGSGFMGSYTFGDHTVALASFNNIGDSADVSGFNQTSGVTGLTYLGSFMDKNLGAVLSYHMVNPVIGTSLPTTPTKEGANTYSTIGFKYNQTDWDMAIDHNSVMTESAVDNKKSDMLASTVFSVGYSVTEEIDFKVKMESSSKKNFAVADPITTATTGTGAAIEFKPISDINFRYHLAYTTVSSKDSSLGAKAKVENHLIAGIRINTDFLK